VGKTERLNDIRNFVGLYDVVKLVELRRSKFIDRLLDSKFFGLILGQMYVVFLVYVINYLVLVLCVRACVCVSRMFLCLLSYWAAFCAK